jgi:hypothetical protein
VSWPQIVFGAALVVALLGISLYYAWRQVWALRRLRQTPDLPGAETRYVRRQAWRRLAGCVLMLVMAGLLAFVLIYMEGPVQEVAYLREAKRAAGLPHIPAQDETDLLNRWVGSWIAILLMLMAVIFLAAWDLWATRLYGVREFRKIQADRRAMIERQAARMRRQRNGQQGGV